MSKISNTVNHVSCLLKESKHLLLQSSVRQKLIIFGNQIPENVMGKAGNICDLLLLRENSVISLFTYEELTSMILFMYRLISIFPCIYNCIHIFVFLCVSLFFQIIILCVRN